MKLPPIPGLHKRKCKECKETVSIPDGMTEIIESDMFVEKRVAKCPSCHTGMVLVLSKGENHGTSEDVRWLDAVFRRMFGKNKIG